MPKYDAYSVACNPDSYTVLGLHLRPLSLGKILIFQRLGLPYFNDAKTEVDFYDFITAVFICALTYEEFQNLVNEHPYKLTSWENIKSLGKAHRLSPLAYQVHKWSKEISKAIKVSKDFNLFVEIEKFNKYLSCINNEPDIIASDSNGNKNNSGAPWTLGLITVLTGNLGYTFNEVVEMPIAKAIWEFYKYAESQGNVEFFDMEELEAQGLITKLKE